MSLTAPKWLLQEVREAKRGEGHEKIEQTSGLLARLGLPTVCDSARCPNRGECFSHRTATFMILGEICTRGCAFCAVQHGRSQQPPDAEEPKRLALAVTELGIKHAVITSVTRDDLADGGAGHFARVVQALRWHCPWVKAELLVPDFGGSRKALATTLQARPDILAHNVETVPRLYRQVRRGADYARSLRVLRLFKELAPDIVTKSGLMLGLGETVTEIDEVLSDLVAVGCDMITIGQYLAPSMAHFQVARYVSKEEFEHWRTRGLELGFKSVASGPLVRSSYKAPTFFQELA